MLTPSRLCLATLLLCVSTTAAHAQIGWEVEWHSADLTVIDTSGTAPEGKPFYVKEVLGQFGNWLVTSDDVKYAVSCPPALTGRFTTLVAYDRKDQVAHARPHAGRCYKGVIEFKTAVPRTTATDIEADFRELRAVLERLRAQPVTTEVSGMGPLDGTGNGCHNAFPCVLEFPYYAKASHALNGGTPMAGRRWYLVVQPNKGGVEDIRPQVNINIDLDYFAARSGNNPFLDAQFAELWETTQGWQFADITAHTLTTEKRGFYRVFGYYAAKLDGLAKEREDLARMFKAKVVPPQSAPQVAGKNRLNPNPKVDFCQLRASFGVSLRTYKPLHAYFGDDGTRRVYRIINETPLKVLELYQLPSCPFTTSDVGLLPFLSQGGPITAGKRAPVFELRHPGSDDQACFALTAYVGDGKGDPATLAANCYANISTF